MSTRRVGVVTVVRGRHDHLAAQVRGLRRQTRGPDVYVVVAMDDPLVHDVVRAEADPDWDVRLPSVSCPDGLLPLAAARNLGAATATLAGVDDLVFLDVDCVPDPRLVERYAEVLAGAPVAAGPVVLCGGVAYEQPPPSGSGEDRGAPRHHPARPLLPATAVEPCEDVTLFWSLSFAVSVADFCAVGGFDERYVGYGAEDTDFGQRLVRSGGRLSLVGGAEAVHQYHDSADPPVDHLADIVRNANAFAEVWGWWPMETWLERFRALGLAERGPDGRWSVTGP
ncbi:glycosyltransferase family 2 protein [Oryzobacter terrae]|uniref:glycosyltransferase family 2 protein n=1 Tax=Oryzobacter terrae TaxID=1620385 RepID=UPI00366AC2B9